MRLVPAILIASLLAACTPPAPVPVPAPAPSPATVATTPPAPMPSPEAPIAGGYAPASLDDEMVKAAQAVAVDAIYTRNPTRALVETVEAEQQVVAGMNYNFKITMTGGARYGVTVFRALDGKMEVSNYERLN
jgi:Cystatin domain